MRFVTALAFVFVQGCGVAFADWPYPEKATWPYTEVASRVCDCQPCTCDPAKCVCPNCANGCKKAGATVTTETPSEIGVDLPQIPRFPAPAQPATPAPAAAPQTVSRPAYGPFHYEQRCVNGRCHLVMVADYPDGVPPQASPVMGAYYAAPCASCGTNGAFYSSGEVYGAGGQGGCGSGTGGPIRRIFRRIFRGRRGGGCGG